MWQKMRDVFADKLVVALVAVVVSGLVTFGSFLVGLWNSQVEAAVVAALKTEGAQTTLKDHFIRSLSIHCNTVTVKTGFEDGWEQTAANERTDKYKEIPFPAGAFAAPPRVYVAWSGIDGVADANGQVDLKNDYRTYVSDVKADSFRLHIVYRSGSIFDDSGVTWIAIGAGDSTKFPGACA